MNFEKIKYYLKELPESEECFPFGINTYVYKIKGKMFALLTSLNGKDIINLKCNPNESLFLRDFFKDIIPAYHMNKIHWNTVFLDGDVSTGEIERLIDNSYLLVCEKLKKVDKKYLILKHSDNRLFSKYPNK
jgi:predicted DNA-binding protein (MmcQ/YjbR family)